MLIKDCLSFFNRILLINDWQINVDYWYREALDLPRINVISLYNVDIDILMYIFGENNEDVRLTEFKSDAKNKRMSFCFLGGIEISDIYDFNPNFIFNGKPSTGYFDIIKQFIGYNYPGFFNLYAKDSNEMITIRNIKWINSIRIPSRHYYISHIENQVSIEKDTGPYIQILEDTSLTKMIF